MPWYFLILDHRRRVRCWAMNRLRDSRLGRAWMAIREDETAADCTGVNPIKTKLLAFALGASFSGFAGSVYAAKLQAITPGAFEFQVSIMLLCMVVLGGAGSLKGVILGGMLITLFDRVLLSQTTFLVRWVGRALGIPSLAAVDLTLWRWFFFGLGLVVVMLLQPEGLAGRRVRPPAADVDEREEALALEPRRPAARGRHPGLASGASGAPARAATGPLLEVRGLTNASAASSRSTRSTSSSPARDHGADRPERRRQDDLLQHGHRPAPSGPGRDPLRRRERPTVDFLLRVNSVLFAQLL